MAKSKGAFDSVPDSALLSAIMSYKADRHDSVKWVPLPVVHFMPPSALRMMHDYDVTVNPGQVAAAFNLPDPDCCLEEVHTQWGMVRFPKRHVRIAVTPVTGRKRERAPANPEPVEKPKRPRIWTPPHTTVVRVDFDYDLPDDEKEERILLDCFEMNNLSDFTEDA